LTGLLIVSLIVLAITLLTIIKHKRFLESYYQELLDTLQESRAVKAELENLMNKAVELSDQLVTKLERSAFEAHQPVPGDKNINQLGGAEEISVNHYDDHPIFMETTDLYDPGDKDDNGELPMLHHQVVSLYRQGYSIKDIASKLNRGQGEVSLILNISNITSKRGHI